MPSTPTPLADVALADQIAAAARETQEADLSSWLLPEGVSHSLSVDITTASTGGPVTQAFITWLTDSPHEAGCRLAAAAPRPLFATVEDPAVFCAACFDDLIGVAFTRRLKWCSVCRYDADDLSPTTMRLGLFTVLAFVCTGCASAERKASVVSRYRALTGYAARSRRDGEAAL